jgi:hypothetical protein
MLKKILPFFILVFIGCMDSNQPKKTSTLNCTYNNQSKKVSTLEENENIILNKPEKRRSSILTLYVVGEGVAPVNAVNLAQAKVLARRAAISDAYRQLAEKMYGVKVTAKESVKDLILRNSSVNTYVEGLIRGANIQSEKFENGIYYVTMNLKLDVRKWNKFISNN